MRLFHLSLFLLLYQYAPAQSLKIGVLDVDSIIEHSVAYQTLRKNWKTADDSIQIVLEKEKERLQHLAYYRVEYRGYFKVSFDYDTLEQYFESFATTAATVQTMQSELFVFLNDSIKNTFQLIVDSIAFEQGYDFILNKSLTLSASKYFSPRLNNNIITRLNQHYPYKKWEHFITPLFEENQVFVAQHIRKTTPSKIEIAKPLPFLIITLLRPHHY